MELKAPGKGADPRRFRDAHDRAQWAKLQFLPNLIYTDGNAFSLWRSGRLEGEIIRLDGDIESAGAALRAPSGLESLFKAFLSWEPTSPTNARGLAEISAGLCRLLREEVREQLHRGVPMLTGLAADWRRLLFPEASNEQFADGYAQAVTFGLLMARAQGISLANGLDRVARQLSRTDTVIGNAFRVLTNDMDEEGAAPGHEALKTSLGTLVAVLDKVDWATISRGNAESWLYFYEHFLEVYDNTLRRRTGSYYTPPEVVTAMVRLVDEALRDPALFGVSEGLASADVTLADPAMGTGTFLLGVLRRVAELGAADGEGQVPGMVQAALGRMVGFELQFGPFAVAQLRLLAEVGALMGLTGTLPATLRPRVFVTDTLGNPYAEEEYIPQILMPLADSRRQANAVKRGDPITVVIGNPPYRERANGMGGWVENGSPTMTAPLRRWQPPPAWGVSAHTKHLRNLYIYFWRWATWKVFGDAEVAPQAALNRRGLVCYITVAGFLNGPGFQKMRADLRETADDIWVIDCSPDGHQPPVATRVFEGVQQPVCIVLVARSGRAPAEAGGAGGAALARVHYRALPLGRREEKFAALGAIRLDDGGWVAAPCDARAPFLPALGLGWAAYPALDTLFGYHGSGVMPGRVWVVAPDRDSLVQRWQRLVAEQDPARKEMLFHPHGSLENLGDRHVARVVTNGLSGHPHRNISVRDDRGPAIPPARFAFRSFDRQWIIPDARLINRPNPTLWAAHSDQQVYLTALMAHSPTAGPAISFSGLIPDLHHYKGSFGGRTFPLWADAAASQPNVSPALLTLWSARLNHVVTPVDVMAYLAAIAAHPAYVARFAADLVQPGLRIPLTADTALFQDATALGRELVWLHSYGERFADATAGRPAGPPRLPDATRPTIPRDGAISTAPADMPDALRYDAAAQRLHLGSGFIDRVPPAAFAYEVSGKNVLTQWFSYRRRNRERPIIGERRQPSELGDIQPDHWLPEYTSELLNLLNVLGRLVLLEPQQAALLEQVCAGPMLTAPEFAAVMTDVRPAGRRRAVDPRQDVLIPE